MLYSVLNFIQKLVSKLSILTKAISIKILIIIICAFLNTLQGCFEVSLEDSKKIGTQIWKNECGGKVEGLTSWNHGEEFASMGIGHFIWFPQDKTYPFKEQFPLLLAFLEKNDVELPDWLKKDRFCPWPNRDTFLQATESNQLKELRSLLLETVDLQVIFMINRLRESIDHILNSTSPQDANRIQSHFASLSSTPQGLYALIDYVNFKGDGMKALESYRSMGWGLLQVIENMPFPLTSSPIEAFIISAKKVLKQRTDNAPKERKEERWLPGWYNRLDTYKKF